MFDSISFSDVHLGSPYCNLDQFLLFLEQILFNKLVTKKLVIVGDFIDYTYITKHGLKHWDDRCDRIVEMLTELSYQIPVHYVLGNHEAGHNPIPDSNIQYHNPIFVDGTTLYTHGHLFSDRGSGIWKHIYNWGYGLITPFARCLKRWNVDLIAQLKASDEVQDYILKFIYTLLTYLGEHYPQCNAIVTGHIHNAQVLTINKTTYVNCGDWVDSLTYVTAVDGVFEVNVWGDN